MLYKRHIDVDASRAAASSSSDSRPVNSARVQLYLEEVLVIAVPAGKCICRYSPAGGSSFSADQIAGASAAAEGSRSPSREGATARFADGANGAISGAAPTSTSSARGQVATDPAPPQSPTDDEGAARVAETGNSCSGRAEPDGTSSTTVDHGAPRNTRGAVLEGDDTGRKGNSGDRTSAAREGVKKDSRARENATPNRARPPESETDKDAQSRLASLLASLCLFLHGSGSVEPRVFWVEMENCWFAVRAPEPAYIVALKMRSAHPKSPIIQLPLLGDAELGPTPTAKPKAAVEFRNRGYAEWVLGKFGAAEVFAQAAHQLNRLSEQHAEKYTAQTMLGQQQLLPTPRADSVTDDERGPISADDGLELERKKSPDVAKSISPFSEPALLTRALERLMCEKIVDDAERHLAELARVVPLLFSHARIVPLAESSLSLDAAVIEAHEHVMVTGGEGVSAIPSKLLGFVLSVIGSRPELRKALAATAAPCASRKTPVSLACWRRKTPVPAKKAPQLAITAVVDGHYVLVADAVSKSSASSAGGSGSSGAGSELGLQEACFAAQDEVQWSPVLNIAGRDGEIAHLEYAEFDTSLQGEEGALFSASKVAFSSLVACLQELFVVRTLALEADEKSEANACGVATPAQKLDTEAVPNAEGIIDGDARVPAQDDIGGEELEPTSAASDAEGKDFEKRREESGLSSGSGTWDGENLPSSSAAEEFVEKEAAPAGRGNVLDESPELEVISFGRNEPARGGGGAPRVPAAAESTATGDSPDIVPVHPAEAEDEEIRALALDTSEPAADKDDHTSLAAKQQHSDPASTHNGTDRPQLASPVVPAVPPPATNKSSPEDYSSNFHPSVSPGVAESQSPVKIATIERNHATGILEISRTQQVIDLSPTRAYNLHPERTAQKSNRGDQLMFMREVREELGFTPSPADAYAATSSSRIDGLDAMELSPLLAEVEVVRSSREVPNSAFNSSPRGGVPSARSPLGGHEPGFSRPSPLGMGGFPNYASGMGSGSALPRLPVVQSSSGYYPSASSRSKITLAGGDEDYSVTDRGSAPVGTGLSSSSDRPCYDREQWVLPAVGPSTGAGATAFPSFPEREEQSCGYYGSSYPPPVAPGLHGYRPLLQSGSYEPSIPPAVATAALPRGAVPPELAPLQRVPQPPRFARKSNSFVVAPSPPRGRSREVAHRYRHGEAGIGETTVSSSEQRVPVPPAQARSTTGTPNISRSPHLGTLADPRLIPRPPSQPRKPRSLSSGQNPRIARMVTLQAADNGPR